MGSNKRMDNMNLFTDIFEENEKVYEPEEEKYWYSKYERKAYEYTTRSLRFFCSIRSRVPLKSWKWILFIPIWGTMMYIMALILDTDMIGFFKHLLGMV